MVKHVKFVRSKLFTWYWSVTSAWFLGGINRNDELQKFHFAGDGVGILFIKCI